MSEEEKVKQVKNIAAVVYLVVLAFLVGGSWWHQQQNPEMPTATSLSSR